MSELIPTNALPKRPPGWKLHLRIQALARMALANLWFKKLRSGITIIGIAIGAGSIFALISFGLGIQALVTSQIAQGEAINTVDITVAGSRVLRVTDETVKQVASTSHVKQAEGYYALAGKLTIGKATAEVVSYGVDKLYLQTSNLAVKEGRQLDPNRGDEIVIGNSILEAVGIRPASKALGDTVTLVVKQGGGDQIEKKFTISGVITSGSGSEVFVSASVFRDADVASYAGAKALVDDRQNIGTVRRSVEGSGFTTTSPADTLEQVDQFFRMLRIVLVSFGAIGMIIAILGMINTLTISLLERTREVALMMTLGAMPGDMKHLFIIEAILLSLIGGFTGIIGALGLGAIVDAILNRLAVGRGSMEGFTVFSSPPWLILLTLFTMAVVGFLVAYLPARHASRINSVDALRRE